MPRNDLTRKRFVRMQRSLHQASLDYIALHGGGKKEKAAYEKSARVLLGPRLYQECRLRAR